MYIPLPRPVANAIIESALVPDWLFHSVTERPPFDPGWVSAVVLKMPEVINGELRKGAIILNQVDAVLGLFPILRDLFFVIERRGWWGLNYSRLADIKLVEDSSTLEVTRRRYPEAVLLDMSGADFVDENAFRPLDLAPDFDVIQIACWSKRKRIELMLDAAALLPELRFVHLGHLENRGSEEEFAYREACIRKSRQCGANVHFAFADARGDDDIPTEKHEVNRWINRAKIGLLTTTLEGRNRFKMECLCADRPVLLPRDSSFPTKRFIAGESGRLYEPTAAALADAIRETLIHLDRFRPREYILARAGKTNSVRRLRNALQEVCRRHDQPYDFDDVDWDGRNESMRWGEVAMTYLDQVISESRRLLARVEPIPVPPPPLNSPAAGAA